MAGEEIINVTAESVENLLTSVGDLALWLQTLGLVIALWIGFEIFTLILQFKRKRSLKDIQDKLSRLERKIDKLLKK